MVWKKKNEENYLLGQIWKHYFSVRYFYQPIKQSGY